MVKTELRLQVIEEEDRIMVTIDEGHPKGGQCWEIQNRADYLDVRRDGLIIATSIAGISPFNAAVDLMFEEIKKATRGLTEQIGAKIRQLTGEPTIQFDQTYPVRSE